jgi:hypothetical protein
LTFSSQVSLDNSSTVEFLDLSEVKDFGASFWETEKMRYIDFILGLKIQIGKKFKRTLQGFIKENNLKCGAELYYAKLQFGILQKYSR